MKLPEDIETLEKMLRAAEDIEDWEACIKIRDKIKELGTHVK